MFGYPVIDPPWERRVAMAISKNPKNISQNIYLRDLTFYFENKLNTFWLYHDAQPRDPFPHDYSGGDVTNCRMHVIIPHP
jgi:hypothetical protein